MPWSCIIRHWHSADDDDGLLPRVGHGEQSELVRRPDLVARRRGARDGHAHKGGGGRVVHGQGGGPQVVGPPETRQVHLKHVLPLNLAQVDVGLCEVVLLLGSALCTLNGSGVDA